MLFTAAPQSAQRYFLIVFPVCYLSQLLIYLAFSIVIDYPIIATYVMGLYLEVM